MQRAFRRMNTGRSAISSEPLSDDRIRAVAPSVFATEAHISRSDRYSYIPTSDVLAGLRREGFQPFAVAQSRCRVPGKADFTKHMLRLRQVQHIGIGTNQEVPEIILTNSHDGTSAYNLMQGMFRFVCFNGMVCGDVLNNVKVPHKGDVVGRVIEGAFTVVKGFDTALAQVDGMKSITLADAEQRAFAAAALELRYDTSEAPAPIAPAALLIANRSADAKSDLWTTFNRVQENVIRGGLSARNANGRRSTTREITGIDQSVKLNRALWVLAEQMRAIKQAA